MSVKILYSQLGHTNPSPGSTTKSIGTQSFQTYAAFLHPAMISQIPKGSRSPPPPPAALKGPSSTLTAYSVLPHDCSPVSVTRASTRGSQIRPHRTCLIITDLDSCDEGPGTPNQPVASSFKATSPSRSTIGVHRPRHGSQMNRGPPSFPRRTEPTTP